MMAYNPYPYPQYTPYYPAPMPDPMQMRQQQQMMQPQAQQQQTVAPQMNIPAQQNVPTMTISASSRPVGNREEANSVPADFGGSLMVFPDLSHDKVYLKRWNFATGTADFFEYSKVNSGENEPQKEEVSFVTMDYAEALSEEVKSLKERISALKNEIDKLKKPVPAKKETKRSEPDDELE